MFNFELIVSIKEIIRRVMPLIQEDYNKVLVEDGALKPLLSENKDDIYFQHMGYQCILRVLQDKIFALSKVYFLEGEKNQLLPVVNTLINTVSGTRDYIHTSNPLEGRNIANTLDELATAALNKHTETVQRAFLSWFYQSSRKFNIPYPFEDQLYDLSQEIFRLRRNNQMPPVQDILANFELACVMENGNHIKSALKI